MLGLAGLLAGFSPLAALAVLGAAIPFLAEAHFSAVHYEIKQRRTLDERRAGYLGQMLTSESYAKEVKLFGLRQLFLDRYESIQRGFLSEDRNFAMKRGFHVTLLYFASTVIFYGVFVWIALAALNRHISIGEMTMYLLVFRQAQSSLSTAMNGLARTLGDTLYLRNLFGFLKMAEDEPHTEAHGSSKDSVSAAQALRVTPATVEFDHVTFCYPGSDRVALKDLSLKVAAGETIAIVGKNGAGKSTLVKLLSGLYSPTSGRILVDGKDVSQKPLSEVRRQVSVILQDFAHYHFSAADNIGLGDVEFLTDLPRISNAAVKGGATDVIVELPLGLQTILGRVFGGEQLSVGQWQRIALSRAFMRPSPILILDEPTSAIDPEGEYELFLRMKELAKDRTCILITHRFSTVRIADRIITIEDGQIIEDGSHQELLQKNGTYAHMFNLQAEGYQ